MCSIPGCKHSIHQDDLCVQHFQLKDVLVAQRLYGQLRMTREQAVEAERISRKLGKLKDISDHCEGLAAGEEIQTLDLEDRYYLSANYPAQSSRMRDRMADIQTYLRNDRPTAPSMPLYSGTPLEAAGKVLTSFKAVIVGGQSSDTAKVHAEQTLLIVLAHRLSAGLVPGPLLFLGVAGNKIPCRRCRITLHSFARALDEVYGRKLHFSRVTEGARGNVERLNVLSLADVPDGATDQFPQFKTLYTQYKDQNLGA